MRIIHVCTNNSLNLLDDMLGYLSVDITDICLYLFQDVNSFLTTGLEENWALQRTDDIQGQICKHLFKFKRRIPIVLSNYLFSQHTRFKNL